MTRPEKIAKAVELRAQGWTYERIGWELGVSYATAQRWVNPDAAERDRRGARARNQRNRAALCAAAARRKAGVFKCRHCQKPTGAVDEAGEPCCRACRAERELAANKATATCACGERMLVATHDGLCGFCREERYLGIAA